MEDEARTILRNAAAVEAGTATDVSRPRAMRRAPEQAARKVAPEAQAGPGAAPADAKRALLIIGGGIAAYKSLDLIRRLKERGIGVRCILTAAAQQFVTPLAAGALSGERVFTDLFDAASEFDVGHIRLAREADLIIVAPATADLIAKMAGGHADDLATAVLLATDAPVLIAPAMNPHMWAHPATRRNLAQLTRRRSHRWSDRTPARWPNAARPASAAWPSRSRSWLQPSRCFGITRRPAARGHAHDRDLGPDA